ncbi:hypothetical protein GCM10011491_35780 [Brucella endophytica]|uniref:Uncharacterized protein n=1 Tax=Brucella endophytica TaxID=1963359 RepID=A0A916WIK5_9HYPH|nr:hypothetical protein GCM10011491_35780 [Brucella endophytica]
MQVRPAYATGIDADADLTRSGFSRGYWLYAQVFRCVKYDAKHNDFLSNGNSGRACCLGKSV